MNELPLPDRRPKSIGATEKAVFLNLVYQFAQDMGQERRSHDGQVAIFKPDQYNLVVCRFILDQSMELCPGAQVIHRQAIWEWSDGEVVEIERTFSVESQHPRRATVDTQIITVDADGYEIEWEPMDEDYVDLTDGEEYMVDKLETEWADDPFHELYFSEVTALLNSLSPGHARRLHNDEVSGW